MAERRDPSAPVARPASGRSGNAAPGAALGGRRLARVALGTASFADAGADPAGVVAEALRHPDVLLDTAPLYGMGAAERLLGEQLAAHGRGGCALSTKVGNEVTADGAIVERFTRDDVLRSVERSLALLRTDRLDLVHVHEPHQSEPTPERFARLARDVVLPALRELRDEGVVGALSIGVNHEAMATALVRERAIDWVLLAYRYSLLEQEAARTLLPLCAAQGVGVLIGGIYNSGVLATGAVPGARFNYRDVPPLTLVRVRELQALCDAFGVALPVLALRFVLAHPAVAAVVVGARTGAEAAAAFAAEQADVPAELWTELRARRLVAPHAPLPA